MTESATKKARYYFSSEYNCAQSVLRSVLEHKKLQFPEATQAMAAFGGGIAHQGETCGAVSGALAAIGVVLGSKISSVVDHKNRSYEVADEFLKRFNGEFGTTHCSGLVGVDMRNPDERRRAMESGRIKEICPRVVEKAVSLVLEVL